MIRLVLLVGLLGAGAAMASDTVLAGNDGHPRARLPLSLYVASFGDAVLDGTAARAVDDWNRVARDVLGVPAFARVETPAAAAVTVDATPGDAKAPMGVTHLEAGAGGVITLPVRIGVQEPAARGQTSPETILYQVLAHELGHALGLAHTKEPRSLMCCVHASLDFNDPLVRAAYIEARRHPDVGSVREQLGAHYERFWRR